MAWSLQALPELSDQDFQEWSTLLEERTGIQLAQNQRGYLQTQITIRMRELGYTNYNLYFQRVVDRLQGLVEWSTLVDRLVVKETSFFRHRPSIELVRRLLQQKIDNNTLKGSFEVWSAGCATGEEAYTLSMVVNGCFEQASLNPYYGITATDISLSALEKGRQGIYTSRVMEQMTDEEVKNYFEPIEDGNYKVQAKLRDRVCFTHGNLIEIDNMSTVPMDVIFCQNLLVYFRKWRRRKILNAFINRLKPEGMLVIGLGETLKWSHPDVRRIAAERVQAYQKVA